MAALESGRRAAAAVVILLAICLAIRPAAAVAGPASQPDGKWLLVDGEKADYKVSAVAEVLLTGTLWGKEIIPQGAAGGARPQPRIEEDERPVVPGPTDPNDKPVPTFYRLMLISGEKRTSLMGEQANLVPLIGKEVQIKGKELPTAGPMPGPVHVGWVRAAVAAGATTSQPSAGAGDGPAHKTGTAGSGRWAAVDGESSNYKDIPGGEIEAEGLLWGRKGQPPINDPNVRIMRNRIMFDGNGSAITVGPGGQDEWNFLLVRDGQPMRLVAAGPDTLAKLVGKQIAVRCKSQIVTPAQPQVVIPGSPPTPIDPPTPTTLPTFTYTVGWVRSQEQPALTGPPDRNAGWAAVEGGNDNYKRWVGGEVTLRGKLETSKVNGIGRAVLSVPGRKVQLAKGGPECDKLVGQAVEIRGKILDGKAEDSTQSMSAGWIRPLQTTAADQGWQTINGEAQAYNNLDGPEVLLRGVMTKVAAAAPANVRTPAGIGRGVMIVPDPNAPAPTRPALKTGQRTVLLEADDGLTTLFDRQVEIKCRASHQEVAGEWVWQVGWVRPLGVAPATQP